MREKVETARALEDLPAVGAVVCEGGFSAAQLREVAKLADEDSDEEWARRAQDVNPGELGRMARRAKQTSTGERRARHEARGLRMWWSGDRGMLHLRGQLPDVMGDAFEQTIAKLTERMKPSRGEGWDSFEHRAADALAVLCELADGLRLVDACDLPPPRAGPHAA